MTAPFNDPDFVAQLAASGVVHTPGLAARMLEELSPLLAAEGIDLRNPDPTVDLDDLNAALGRATEQHNLMLFTPVGAQRDAALAVLARFTEYVADRDLDAAAAVLAAVPRDPVGEAAGISHVIGVGLEAADAWHTSSRLGAVLAGTRLPRWNQAARAAATDVLALARKGRAAMSVDRLHRHGGLALLEGTALVVAASLIARAAAEHVSVRGLAAQELISPDRHATAGPSTSAAPAAGGTARSGRSFRRPDHPTALRPGAAGGGGEDPSFADRGLRRDFRAWLREDPESTAATAEHTATLLVSLMASVRRHGLDLRRPGDVTTVIASLTEDDDDADPDVRDALLSALHDYVHFRLDESAQPEDWEHAHAVVEDALAARAGSDLLDTLLQDARRVAPTVRRHALADTALIGAVTPLLDWIGASRPVTQTGGVRRADLREVAALLGINRECAQERQVRLVFSRRLSLPFWWSPFWWSRVPRRRLLPRRLRPLRSLR